MSQLIDLAGQKFGRLTVIGLAEIVNRQSYWNCVCDCGKTKVVSACHLKDGHAKSCGCLNRELLSSRKIHGLSRKRLHNIWCSMKARCRNPRVIVSQLWRQRHFCM
jgi:hypothetical protein